MPSVYLAIGLCVLGVAAIVPTVVDALLDYRREHGTPGRCPKWKREIL